MKNFFLIFIVCLSGLAPAQATDSLTPIELDARSPGRVFEGIGAVSAGASTRLLIDYPEPQRSQILDYLFKPRFGAGFQHLKVEIGSGENSTCGSEPSHVISLAELVDPKPRGYEFWLMAEARKRNPEIILDCLPWGFPHWVQERFSPRSADWFVTFLEVARKHYGLQIDWISAAQNENGTDLNWIRDALRPALDANGFTHVKLQAPDDDSEYWQIFDTLETNPELDRLIDAVGYHYVDGRNPWQIDQEKGRHATDKAKQSGKPLWASEEWSQSGQTWDGVGALYLARLMNKLYIMDRITNYQIWCPIDSIYNQIIWSDTGAMQADTPWSGHYKVWPAVWVLAHTTQFAEPGWVYMDAACGQIDPGTWQGSYVAMREPVTGDWSVIIITGQPQTVRLKIAANLKAGPVHVWKSTASQQFSELQPLSLRNGAVELALESDAVYTFTSTTGQQKGSHGTIPKQAAFPLPYEETFESYTPGQTPKYLADQKGTFEVVQRPRGGCCLAQIVPTQGILWYGNALLKPHTVFGGDQWQDIAIQADVLLAGGDAEIGGRYNNKAKARNRLGYRWILSRDGRWQLNWQQKTLASGQRVKFDPNKWHQLRLELNGTRITGFVDHEKLAEVTDETCDRGMAFLASTYDRNLFDNISILPIKMSSRADKAASRR